MRGIDSQRAPKTNEGGLELPLGAYAHPEGQHELPRSGVEPKSATY
jgi:hypothetical protein